MRLRSYKLNSDTIIVTCTYCGSELYYQKRFLRTFPNVAHVCDLCIELMERGFRKSELRNVVETLKQISILNDLENAENMAEDMAENSIKTIWKSEKEFLNSMPKRELAEEMYYQGAADALKLMVLIQALEKHPEKRHILLRFATYDGDLFEHRKMQRKLFRL